MQRQTYRELIVLSCLVALGILGRAFQPEWHFTPIAAISIFAGYYFRSLAVALLVPTAIIAVSNSWLAEYNSRGVMFFVYLCYLFPVALGMMLRKPTGRAATMFKWAACGLAPAVIFFVVTNWAAWQFNGAMLGYASTWEGLAASYTAGIPFFRTMLEGDIVYLAVLFGTYSVAKQWLAVRQPSKPTLAVEPAHRS